MSSSLSRRGVLGGVASAAIGVPLWLALALGFIALIIFYTQKENREKAQKAAEETLAMAMHKQEMEMRLAAERKSAAPPINP